jgi:hypothetical protein
MALDTAQLTEMLRVMILIREFDELAIKLRVAGKIYGAVHPYVGQEAVAVGVCSNLAATDRVTSTHRGHGHCIAKGADIRRMMAELFGRVDGFGVHFTPRPIRNYRDVIAADAEMTRAVFTGLLNEGILLQTACAGSLGIMTTETEIDTLVAAFARVAARVRG